MKQLFGLVPVLLLFACSKPAKITGKRISADVPEGWQVAHEPLGAELAAAFPDIPPLSDGHDATVRMTRTALVTRQRPSRLPGIAIYELTWPATETPTLTAPQANLMGTVASVVGGKLEMTDEMCRRFAQRFGIFAANVAKFARDSVRGCDLQGSDGIRRFAIFWIDDKMTALVACTRREATDVALDRACDRVLSSVFPTSGT